MLVETYEVPEVDSEGQVESDAEAIALIESLGLEGQQELLKPKSDGSTARVPYRKMTKQEAFVYSQICPKKSRLSKYSDGPIPLRVLQVAAHAKDLFAWIEVWSAVDADIKDPVLVGVNGTEYGPQERFLLARWGDELESLPVLAEKAAKLFRDKYKAAVAKIIAKCNASVEAIDATEGEALAEASLPNCYGLVE